MQEVYNIYCDESCHLENDKQKAMVLWAVFCPANKTKTILSRIREIKKKHWFSSDFEIKWTKISPAKEDFYLDIIDYFFDTEYLHFRWLIIPNKNTLNHTSFNQSHDEWYYKMYFSMLKIIFNPFMRYNIYVDIKDTIWAEKCRELHDVISNSLYDFNKNIVKKIQLVHSHEVWILQITDILIWALSYLHRQLDTSSSKQTMIRRIADRTWYSLKKNTLYKEDKFNLFIWQPNEELWV